MRYSVAFAQFAASQIGMICEVPLDFVRAAQEVAQLSVAVQPQLRAVGAAAAAAAAAAAVAAGTGV